MFNALNGEQRHHLRAARNLVAEKGASRWTHAEQAAFDAHMDAADRAAAVAAAPSVSDAAWEGLNIYMRHGAASMAPANVGKLRASISGPMDGGGFALAQPLASMIVNLIKGYGWVRQVATEFTTAKGVEVALPTSDGVEGEGVLLPSLAGVDGGVLSAWATRSAGEYVPVDQFGGADLTAYTFSSQGVGVPVELLQDSSADIVSFVLGKLRDRVAKVQNRLFTVGTGVDQPTGIVTGAAAGKLGPTGQLLTVTYEDLVDLQDSVNVARLPMPGSDAGPRAGWMLSQHTRRIVRRIKDDNGRPIWIPSAMDGARVGLSMLLDYPVYLNSDMPPMGANAKSILFGDLSSYHVRDVVEVGLFRMQDSHYALAGQVGFVLFVRSGGDLLDPQAVKYYQNSAS